MKLFALEGTTALGHAVAKHVGVQLDPHEERNFAGGEHKARPLVSVRDEEVFVLHSLNGDEEHSANDKLIRLLFFLATCRDSDARRVTAIAPYLAYSRKDRQTKPWDPVGTRYVAKLFEAMDVDLVATLEVHNLSAFQNAFRCRTLHLDMDQVFAEAILQRAGQKPVTIASPDIGGAKRARRLLQRLEDMTEKPVGFAIADKTRSEGIIGGELFAGEVEGRSVFVVDDMISTGGTMLKACSACKERGAEAVYAIATHGLFEAGAEQLFTSDAIDGVLVSDSVTVPQLPQPRVANRLQTISCAPVIGDAIALLNGGSPRIAPEI